MITKKKRRKKKRNEREYDMETWFWQFCLANLEATRGGGGEGTHTNARGGKVWSYMYSCRWIVHT